MIYWSISSLFTRKLLIFGEELVAKIQDNILEADLILWSWLIRLRIVQSKKVTWAFSSSNILENSNISSNIQIPKCMY